MAAKKKSAVAGEPRGAPRMDHRWDREHELVESGGVSHFVGALVPGVLRTRTTSTKMMNPRRRCRTCIARSRRRCGCCCCSPGCSLWRANRRPRATTPVLDVQAAPTAPRYSARSVCRARRNRSKTRAVTSSTTAAAIASGLLPYETTATSTTAVI